LLSEQRNIPPACTPSCTGGKKGRVNNTDKGANSRAAPKVNPTPSLPTLNLEGLLPAGGAAGNIANREAGGGVGKGGPKAKVGVFL